MICTHEDIFDGQAFLLCVTGFAHEEPQLRQIFREELEKKDREYQLHETPTVSRFSGLRDATGPTLNSRCEMFQIRCRGFYHEAAKKKTAVVPE